MNSRGTVAVMAAFLAMPLILFVGVAVDASQLWLLRQRMQWSVDAAALLGASQLNSELAPQVKIDAQELFWANYGAAQTRNVLSSQAGFIGSKSTGATVTVSANTVTVTASATLPTSFMNVVPGLATSTVTTTGMAIAPGNVELALVLDNSLSMLLTLNQNDTTTKLDNLKTAASTMVNTLYANAATSSNVYMSVVPFAGAVNAGSGNTAFLNAASYAADFPTSTNPDAAWRGCTQARAFPNDISEAPPTTALFEPYYYDSTLNKGPRPANEGGFYDGDNDWTKANGSTAAINITDTSSSAQTGNTNYLPPTNLTLKGPNLFCPQAAVLKLTNSQSQIIQALNNLKPVNGGGTIINQGLQWGWFTIIPGWASSWNPADSLRPLPYTNTTNTKIIVLMTDGMNEIDGVHSYYGAAAQFGTTNCRQLPNIWPECLRPDSWYTSYGRISSNVLTTPPPTDPDPVGTGLKYMNLAAVELRTRMKNLCDNIKGKYGVNSTPTKTIIYTIFYHGYNDDGLPNAQPGPAHDDLLNCATDSSHFFDSTSSTAIKTAFAQIARDISNIRVAQ